MNCQLLQEFLNQETWFCGGRPECTWPWSVLFCRGFWFCLRGCSSSAILLRRSEQAGVIWESRGCWGLPHPCWSQGHHRKLNSVSLTSESAFRGQAESCRLHGEASKGSFKCTQFVKVLISTISFSHSSPPSPLKAGSGLLGEEEGSFMVAWTMA